VLSPEIVDFFEPRARDIDAAQADIREGIRFLADQGLGTAGILDSSALITTVARSDMASAFSAWAHRMVVLYLSLAPAGSPVRQLLPELQAGTTVGATAMAGGTARYLTDAPLPVTYVRRGDDLVLHGRIPWASNLLAPFVGVTAAVDQEDPDRAVVVAFTDRTPGVSIGPYPDLVALMATGSSTITLDGAIVPSAAVISDSLEPFVERILPPFLLLQSAFCRGLAVRSLDEAVGNLGTLAEVLRPDLVRRRAEAERAGDQLDRLARRVDRVEASGRTTGSDGLAVPLRQLLRLRLRWAHLAAEAVRLELAAVGGRGYLRTGPTARRLREAAFLPIQAPTEVQLRWTLSRSA
jgi:alkylation response protein AidB-like acyl-CoA dehydrogenase